MIRFLTALVVMISLAGCALPGAIPPETTREKLVAAEAAYEVVLLQIKSLVNNGLLKPGTSASRALKVVLTESREALDTWHLNPDDLSFEQASQIALRALQRYLATLVTSQESRYEPSNPRKAEVDSSSAIWLLPALFGITGLILISAAVGSVLSLL